MGRAESTLLRSPIVSRGSHTPARQLLVFFLLAALLGRSFLALPTKLFRVHQDKDPWAGLADHCKHTQPIPGSEFLERQYKLAQALHELNASAYIAEPGASAQFFGNISAASWDLSERPLLLIVSPIVHANQLVPKITVLAPYFEETRAKLLNIPGVDVIYVSWKEDEDPYTIAMKSIFSFPRPRIYVDGMIRHFIVDGFQNAAPGADVGLAPLEIVSLRSRKSPTELALLKCVNEATLLAIQAVQTQMYIGIRESQVRHLIDHALASAGIQNRWALVLLGENAALPHGSGSDRELGVSDFVLIDTGGTLFGYNSDVTRTFMLPGSKIPNEHRELWFAVRDAQTAAFVAAKAGVVTASVDRAARSALAERGLGKYFTHRLGHG
ncbi:peptidase M24, structural domain-containing protein [Scleroderma yunnanense]